MKKLAILGLGICLALSAVDAAAQTVAHGADEYKLCASCHGFRGEGNVLVNAPALGGQESWYLKRQIMNFRSGVRGADDSDAHSRSMALMTRGLDSTVKVDDIVAFVATLPDADPQPTIRGDVAKGQTQYATCAACHGVVAEGNEALNAPALAGLDDWYQLRQLRAFKEGRRGSHEDDTYGQQMRPMASMLADETAMRDVVAFIASLK
jgi:cytochrome c oxidase subunit 2